MKRHINKIIAMAFAAMMIGCEDAEILTSAELLPEDPNPKNQHELLGTWHQMDSNGEKNMDFALLFTEGYLTEIKMSDKCEKLPEVYRVYAWEENGHSDSLSLTTESYTQCGEERKAGNEVVVPFEVQENILEIFENIFVKEKLQAN